ncbi:MAG: hypothetical protein JNK05_01250 [Myxococcales bacterium]|nr:hypothetical protein [Myxococcales bacterium]
MLRLVSRSLTAAALALATRDAVAQELPRARLEFAANAQTERCLDETQLRQLVAARLGRDPFDPAATLTVRVRIERASSAVRATVTRVDGERTSTPRVLVSRRSDCADIGAALGLAVSMTIDPLARTPAIEPALSTPPVAPVVVAPTPAQPEAPREPPPPTRPVPPRITPAPPRAPPARPSIPVELYAAVSPSASVAVLPALALGPQLLVALRYGAIAAAISGRFDTAWPSYFDPFIVYSTLASGSVRLCGVVAVGGSRILRLELCGLGSIGAFAANATMLDRSTPTTSLYASAGAELATSARFGRWLGLRLSVEGAATIIRARQTINEQGRERELWLAPPFSLSFSIGPAVYFL